MKVKIKSRKAPEPVQASTEKPTAAQSGTKKKDSIIRNCMRIVVSDIRKKLYGPVVKMPESDESWEDWKGQL